MASGDLASRLEALAQELLSVARALRAAPTPMAETWTTYSQLKDALPTLSMRAHTVLWGMHIRSLAALRGLGKHVLLSQRNCGRVTCNEIMAFIQHQQSRNGQEDCPDPLDVLKPRL